MARTSAPSTGTPPYGAGHGAFDKSEAIAGDTRLGGGVAPGLFVVIAGDDPECGGDERDQSGIANWAVHGRCSWFSGGGPGDAHRYGSP
jgi:hypothetical protein